MSLPTSSLFVLGALLSGSALAAEPAPVPQTELSRQFSAGISEAGNQAILALRQELRDQLKRGLRLPALLQLHAAGGHDADATSI